MPTSAQQIELTPPLAKGRDRTLTANNAAFINPLAICLLI